jgi:hypothetical protein
MKKFVIFIFVLLCPVLLFAQKGKSKNTGKIGFDTAEFVSHQETAKWLVEYDIAAWVSSDSVVTQDSIKRARLGSDWFCYTDNKNKWHAVYGKFENGQYDEVFHYIYASGKAKFVDIKTDTARSHAYCRAVTNAYADAFESLSKYRIRYNHYVRRNADKSITVWILPAFQPDATAVYGLEFIYQFDEKGENITRKIFIVNSSLKGAKVDKESAGKELTLNYYQLKTPSLGGVFFVLYYRKYFKNISILTQGYKHMLMASDNQWTWVSIELPKEK